MSHNSAMSKVTNTGQSVNMEITNYTDYAPYVADLVRHKREAGGFSYRIFCRKSGFRSPTYLKWVIDGIRSISPRSAHKFAAGLSLDRQETQYFILMVHYKEATDPQTKRSFYEQMLAWRQRRAGSLTKDAYEYLSHWYYVAMRELIATPDFRDDPRWIRDRLGGELSLWEIKNGLETLQRLNLICKAPNGRWQQTTRDLITEDEVLSLAAYNYHSEMLQQAQKALSTLPPESRDYESVVALIDPQTLADLKTKIQDFQKGIIEYLQERERTNGRKHSSQDLYALNLQLLPLVQRGKGDL